MAHNVGLDFGTTYSLISYLKDVKRGKGGVIKDYTLTTSEPREGGHSSCLDTIVAVNESGRYFVGLKARKQVDEDDVRVFKGFKMLLPEEKGSQKLRDRNYDSQYTPEGITEKYITTVINEYCDQYLNGEHIDKLVVGVPEIWFDAAATVDARTKLEEIVRKAKVREVQLVSEPAAACAYFVENYKKNKGCNFVGKILLIDYGGGTLDITLCEVKENGLSSEISVLYRTGAGVSEEGLGKGGVLFLESVVNKALIESGIPEENIRKNNEYYKCIHEVEEALMVSGDDIKDVYEEHEGSKKGIKEKFKTISYDGKKCSVTYGLLAQVFEEVIEPVLAKKLNEIISYLGDEIKVKDRDDFKIALVGGFCNFYLTQDYIERAVERGGKVDKRFTDIISNKRDCEKAISYGTALIANDIIKFRQLAPYTLSIVPLGKDKRPGEVMYKTVLSGMEIDYGVPIFAKHEDGTDALFLADQIPYIRVDFNSGLYKCDKPPIEIKLNRGYRAFKVGFSLDQSLIISFHAIDMGDLNDNRVDPNGGEALNPVRLGDIYSMYGGITPLQGGNKE